MWENGESFGALIVFAEHRFFGKSLPCKGGFEECGDFLGTQQAMADFAVLIDFLKQQYKNAGAVVSFGGSYGGMLAAWMRMRYPNLVQGAIASSAPIGCISANYSGPSYWQVVTQTAKWEDRNCPTRVSDAFDSLFRLGNSSQGLVKLTDIFRLCKPLASGDMEDLAYFIEGAWDALAMGDYPFPSSYISGTSVPAPAFPMKIACSLMRAESKSDADRLIDLYNAMGVMQNISNSAGSCYDISQVNPSVSDPTWDFMVCTEGMINEQPYFPTLGWPSDMFWNAPYSKQRLISHCYKTFDRIPRFGWLDSIMGGLFEKSFQSTLFIFLFSE